MKRICSALCVAAFMIFNFIFFSIGAFAAPADLCTLNVDLSEGDNKDFKNVDFHLLWVTDGNYDYTKDFAGCTITLDEFENADSGKKVYSYASKNGILSNAQVLSSDDAGKASFTGLNQGIYLLFTDKKAGTQEFFSPFLIELPQRTSSGNIHTLTVKPKTVNPPKPRTGITYSVRKIWSDSLSNHPKSVTVRLLNRNGEVARAELSDANNWEYSWNNLNPDEGWKIEEINVPAGYSATYKVVENHTNVINTPNLIQTGQNRMLVYILCISGLVLLVAGMAFRISAGKSSHEK